MIVLAVLLTNVEVGVLGAVLGLLAGVVGTRLYNSTHHKRGITTGSAVYEGWIRLSDLQVQYNASNSSSQKSALTQQIRALLSETTGYESKHGHCLFDAWDDGYCGFPCEGDYSDPATNNGQNFRCEVKLSQLPKLALHPDDALLLDEIAVYNGPVSSNNKVAWITPSSTNSECAVTGETFSAFKVYSFDENIPATISSGASGYLVYSRTGFSDIQIEVDLV